MPESGRQSFYCEQLLIGQRLRNPAVIYAVNSIQSVTYKIIAIDLTGIGIRLRLIGGNLTGD